MNIEKQSSKFIKPLVPTPSTLRHHKIGLLDELAPSMDVRVVLFFSSNNNNLNPTCLTRLEKSLEKTLTHFYPLAGRYIQEIYAFDCNDEGVEFIHAKANIKLQDILDIEANIKFVDKLISSRNRAANPLLTIQATVFECGGVALGVNATHRVVDAYTLSTFITKWAETNREENSIEFIGPGFNSALLFPGRCLKPIPQQTISDDDMSSEYVRKKLSFSESAISNMKAKARANGTHHHHWSKVQFISAIIWKAFIDVDRANNNNNNNNKREYVLLQSINIRGRTSSLIPEHSYGNLWGFCATKAGSVITIEELADCLSDNVKKTLNNFSKVDHNSEEGQLMTLSSLSPPNIQESAHVITLTSWCRFPFYEVDFGFGKPTWVAPGCVPVVNTTLLMDEAGGNGVDVHILLEAKDASYFEKALQVASFAA